MLSVGAWPGHGTAGGPRCPSPFSTAMAASLGFSSLKNMFLFINFFLFEKKRQAWRPLICRFTLKVPTVGRADPGRSLKPGTLSWPPKGQQGPSA